MFGLVGTQFGDCVSWQNSVKILFIKVDHVHLSVDLTTFGQRQTTTTQVFVVDRGLVDD